MSVWGISYVKDEGDVIRRTVLHMLEQVDRVLIVDNASSDGTKDILADIARADPRLIVQHDPSVAHYQSRRLTALAREVAGMGASYVVPFDADELHTSPDGRIADVIRANPKAWILTATLHDHVPTALDGDDPDPYTRMGWRRRDPLPILKIAARTHPDLVICEGSHSCNYAGSYPRTVAELLTIRHFPYRSPEQFISKARNGARGRGATDLHPDIGHHLREYGRILEDEGEDGLRRLYRERFLIADPENDPALIFDPVAALVA